MAQSLCQAANSSFCPAAKGGVRQPESFAPAGRPSRGSTCWPGRPVPATHRCHLLIMERPVAAAACGVAAVSACSREQLPAVQWILTEPLMVVRVHRGVWEVPITVGSVA